MPDPTCALTILVSLVAGAALWSFGEYAIHNWIGHLTKGRTKFSKEHLRHHAETHYFTPTPRKILAALGPTSLAAALSIWLLGPLVGIPFTIGFLGFYVTYEVIHRRVHTHPPTGRYSRWARRHHFYHHFRSPKMNHGVTSPIWDHVFGTYEDPGVIKVPEKHAMPWLLDPETGDVREAFKADYVLARRNKRGRAAKAATRQAA